MGYVSFSSLEQKWNRTESGLSEGGVVTLDEQQILVIAQAIFRDIRLFTQSHPEQYRAFRTSRARKRAGEGGEVSNGKLQTHTHGQDH